MPTLKDVTAVAQSEAVFAVLFILVVLAVGWYIKKVLDQNRESSAQNQQYILEMHERQMGEIKENMLHERNNAHEILMEQRRSFDGRETALLSHLGKNTDQLAHVSDTLKDIRQSMGKLEDRMEDNFHDVWKELGAKIDRRD